MATATKKKTKKVTKKAKAAKTKWPANILIRVRVVGKSIELATKTDKVIDGKLYPAGGNRLGPVLCNTRKHLGVEKDAVPILERLFSESRYESGDLGDIQWWKAGKEFCFGWLGPNKVRWPISTFSMACHTRDDAFRPGQFVIL